MPREVAMPLRVGALEIAKNSPALVLGDVAPERLASPATQVVMKPGFLPVEIAVESAMLGVQTAADGGAPAAMIVDVVSESRQGR